MKTLIVNEIHLAYIEKVKENLSMLAIDLSDPNEVFTEISDDVYLHQKQREEIETGMTNKNIFCEQNAKQLLFNSRNE